MSGFTTVTNEIPRDHYSRPLVVPPEGGKAVPYTRCTRFVDCLDDRFNLEQWGKRMVAIGLAERKDLLLSVAAHRDDKKQLDALCKEASEAGKASAAATTGTALHKLSELVDAGVELPALPDDARADLEAYRRAMTPFEIVGIEQFVVCDDLKVGGTFDRLIRWQGRNYIADIKTGSIEWGVGKIAMQMAVYSRGVRYHHGGRREPLPDVDQNNALIIHLPAGTGTCELVWVDINSGWQAVQLAVQVWAWRKRKGLTAPFTDVLQPTG